MSLARYFLTTLLCSLRSLSALLVKILLRKYLYFLWQWIILASVGFKFWQDIDGFDNVTLMLQNGSKIDRWRKQRQSVPEENKMGHSTIHFLLDHSWFEGCIAFCVTDAQDQSSSCWMCSARTQRDLFPNFALSKFPEAFICYNFLINEISFSFSESCQEGWAVHDEVRAINLWRQSLCCGLKLKKLTKWLYKANKHTITKASFREGVFLL